jgi:2-dehydro-3-deoxyphosphogluconate aldolase/(4S)-4-hydroxy-2-oxoglutarate aldolase
VTHTRSGRYERLVDSGVVAVMRGLDPDASVRAVEALHDGGVTAVEFTADTPGATGMIEEVAASFDDEVIVGAGTVLDAETARAALLAGAEFVVCPSLHADVIETASRYAAPVAPGIMTPTEAVRAVEAGADMVTVFPASTVGPGHLSALKGPLGHVEMMPTGGVGVDNAADFVAAGAACVGVGSALVDDEAIAAGEFEVLTGNAERLVAAVESARAER